MDEQDSELLTAALGYAERGWAVFPVYEALVDGTCACNPGGQCSKGKPGKHPRIMDWPNLASRDEAQIRDWWTDWPEANIGLPVPAGYVVLDVDTRHDCTLAHLGAIPQTVIAQIANGA